MTIPSDLLPSAKEVVNSLVEGRLTANQVTRSTVQGILTAVSKYPGTLSQVPDEAYEKAYVYPTKDSNPPEWMIEVDLWVDGRPSDLTLSLHATRFSKDRVEVRIDDVRVL